MPCCQRRPLQPASPALALPAQEGGEALAGPLKEARHGLGAGARTRGWRRVEVARWRHRGRLRLPHRQLPTCPHCSPSAPCVARSPSSSCTTCVRAAGARAGCGVRGRALGGDPAASCCPHAALLSPPLPPMRPPLTPQMKEEEDEFVPTLLQGMSGARLAARRETRQHPCRSGSHPAAPAAQRSPPHVPCLRHAGRRGGAGGAGGAVHDRQGPRAADAAAAGRVRRLPQARGHDAHAPTASCFAKAPLTG